MLIVVSFLIFAIGSILGSFLVASVYRMRANYGDKNLTKLKNIKNTTDYSRCLNCGYHLKWYDLIPIVSWVLLRGECRKCHAKIGLTEFFSEVMMGCIFLLSFLYWPFNTLNYFIFLIWLVICSILMLIFVFDAKWQEIPSQLLYLILSLSLIFAFINKTISIGTFYSFLVTGGVYLAIYVFSKGKAVGDGDWWIAGSLGVILSNIYLGIMLIFLANLLGTFYVIYRKYIKKQSLNKIAFGPLLIIAFYVIFFNSKFIVLYLLNMLMV